MTESKKPIKAKTDWESIERDYRAGVLSIREVAKIYGITDTAIRKKAKAEKWQRDLTDKVAEKVRADLVRDAVRTTDAKADARTEKEIVEGAAAMVVQVVREHRAGINSGRGIVSLLMSQLTDVAGKRDDFEAAIALETEGDKTSDRYNRLMKAVSIPAHASTVRDLSTAMKNLIFLERQAFNIGNESDGKDPLSELLESVAARGNRLPIKE